MSGTKWKRCRPPRSLQRASATLARDRPTTPRPTPPGGSTFVERRLFEARLGRRARSPSIRLEVMGSALGADRCASPARSSPDDGLLHPLDRRRRANDAAVVRSKPTSPPRVRTMRVCILPGTFWIGTMGRTGRARSRRDLCAPSGRNCRCSTRRITIPNAICFSPDGDRSAISPTPAKNTLYRVDARSGDRPAARRSPRRWLRAPGWRRHRRRGGRCRRADLERALGRRLRRRLQSAQASVCVVCRCRRGSSELPGLRRADFFASAGHVGLAGHGRAA